MVKLMLSILVFFVSISSCKKNSGQNPIERISNLTSDSSIISLSPDSFKEYFDGIFTVAQKDSTEHTLRFTLKGRSQVVKSGIIEFLQDANSKQWTPALIRIVYDKTDKTEFEMLKSKYKSLFGIDGHPVKSKEGMGEEWHINDDYYLYLFKDSKTGNATVQVHILEEYD